MASISEVYKKYKINLTLQEHQLRVAAIAKQICDNLTVPVNSEVVMKACLIHDMGNVLKFDLDDPAHPEWLEPEGVEYWRQVQKEFKEKYGPSEHEASLKIARELGASNEILTCIQSLNFAKAKENLARKEIEPKICDNADLRAIPNAVVSLDERLEEGRKRYQNRPEYWIRPKDWDRLAKACHDIERQVFQNCKIRPEDITEKSTRPIMEQLRSYEI